MRIPLSDGRYLVFQPWEYPLISLTGIALFLLTMHLARLMARAHARYARRMLLPWRGERLAQGDVSVG